MQVVQGVFALSCDRNCQNRDHMKGRKSLPREGGDPFLAERETSQARAILRQGRRSTKSSGT